MGEWMSEAASVLAVSECEQCPQVEVSRPTNLGNINMMSERVTPRVATLSDRETIVPATVTPDSSLTDAAGRSQQDYF